MSKIKPPNEPEQGQDKHLTKKEMAKQFRHDAYLRAKEFRKTDPRQIVLKEKLKEQRREAYKKGKERRKAYQAEIKKVLKVKDAAAKIKKQNELKEMIAPGSSIKNDSGKRKKLYNKENF
jgi:hypothetical protein